MINFRYLKYINILMLIVALPLFVLHAEGDKRIKNTKSLNKTTGEPSYKKLNINNISTFFKNNGESDINPNGNSGFEFPKGSNKQCVFQSGFVWGGEVDGQKRVGGSAYRQGTLPGKVLNSGVPADQLIAEDPDAPNVRNYRVRPDYKTGDVGAEIKDGEGTEDQIRTAYEKDWNEWPAADGAPYTDASGVYYPSGGNTYNPATCTPGVNGADQTIWFVCNDVDPDQSAFMYGSPPMGIEEQVTAWAYKSTGALGNMLFRKYRIINKSNADFNNMYVSMWNDPDNGDATDDYVGSDTTLSLVYCYNGKANDATYGNNPPATGFDFFQGPIVDAPGDSGIFEGKRVYGKKNLPMTASYFFINPDPIYADPDQGEYSGTTQWFYLFDGRITTTGEKFTDPTTGQPTNFCLAGDPLTGVGWIDGLLNPPDDRRAGSVSGPFTMAAGDTQEVVVAEIAAGGFTPVDRLGAVGLLKYYDLQAQLVYDNFFDIPKAPTNPRVDASELDQEIILDWSETAKEIESYGSKGFKFEGYNIYQLPSASATFSDAKRVATYDVINGVGKIEGLQFDVETGVVGRRVLQFGSDAGIQRYIHIKTDALKGFLPIVNGTRYYFAVTAYAYNPDPDAVPNVLETPLQVVTNSDGQQYLVPHSPDPGVRYYAQSGTSNEATHATGSSTASAEWNVIDPSKITGDQYEIFFNQQHYYLDQNGQWQKTNFPDSIGKHLGKIGDVSPSTMSGTGVYADKAGTIDLMMSIDLQTPDGDFIDGVKLTFPDGIVINGASDVTDCANGNTEAPVIDGQTIMWGNNDSTTFGCFDGSQVLKVNVNSFNLPLDIAYILYDDGYGDLYAGDTLGIINAEGSFQITAIGNKFATQQHWNVRDITTGNVVLEDQTVLGGKDIYYGVEGPGGSSESNLGSDVPGQGSPIFDGIQVTVNGSYTTPIVFQSVKLTKGTGSTTTLTTKGSVNADGIDIANYNIFSGISTSWALEDFGVGTDDIDILQQDYELRFTGVWDTTVTGAGDTLITIKSGGQMATIFSTVAGSGGLADNPLNPSPGTAAPFLIRIPFEVWNIDQNKQVNIAFRDRAQALDANPFWGWNINNRTYAVLNNSDYSETAIIPPDDNSTWTLVFYSLYYHVGDKITVTYANPIQLGKDTYTFQTPSAPLVSQDSAKMDVNRINVFPNPYYGVNPQEINKYQRFVTFNHLPRKATIRIFNLAGQLVRTIQKDAPDQFQRWDLLTDSGLPVPSGLYIVYVDMPDLGTSKILKAAIVQEQQILDRF